MVKITAVGVMRWNGEAPPTMFGLSSDLSSFSFFQRNSVKEFLVFTSRTVVGRTQPGQRQSVEHQEYLVHVHVRDSGLAAIVFADKTYPSRAAFCIAGKVMDDFVEKKGDSWRSATADSEEAKAILDEALVKYQDPAAADKLTKIQRDLDETKIVLHKTIESVLERGEKLENLVDKSNDLSMASQLFYRQAKKSNNCCNMM